MASFGAAVCHGPSPFHVSGTCAAGRLYRGPTVHPTVHASNVASSQRVNIGITTEGDRITNVQLPGSVELGSDEPG
jgi:hypothetical protein